MKKLAIFLALVMLFASFTVSAAPALLNAEVQVSPAFSGDTGDLTLTVSVNEETTAGTVSVLYDNAALTFVSCDFDADLVSVKDTGSEIKLVYSNLEAKANLTATLSFAYDCTESATTVMEIQAQVNGEGDETTEEVLSMSVDLLTEADICPSRTYTDLSRNRWYHEAVDYVLNTGLMNGMSKTTFAPDANTTRAQFVTVLSRMAGVDIAEYEGESEFTDVSGDDWFAPYVVWAAEQGLVQGDGNGTFRPNSPISRQELVTILARFAGAEAEVSDVLADYDDAHQVADWAMAAMSWAVESGIIQGYANYLEPAGNATRAQIAQIITNFHN